METQGLLWDVFVFGKTLLVGFVLVRRIRLFNKLFYFLSSSLRLLFSALLWLC